MLLTKMPNKDDQPPDVFGIGTLGAAAMNMGSSIIMNNVNNAEAARREELARQENYMYNEKAADAADARTRALYNDLYSPQAQMQQIKEAGLSPSLFYGDAGGMSGQSGAQGGGAAGIAPTPYGMPNLDFALMAKAISEAKLNEAKADTERGDNERGQAEIANIYQDTATKLSQENLNEAATAVAQSQETLNELEKQFKSETFWSNVAHVEAEISNLNANTLAMQNAAARTAQEYEFNKEIYDERIKQYKQQGIKLGLEIIGLQKSNAKIEAEIAGIYDLISREQYRLKLEGRKNESENYNRELEGAINMAKLTLMRNGIEYEHADRKANMLVSVFNNLVTTVGAQSIKRKGH